MTEFQRKILIAQNAIETAAAIFSSSAIDAIARRGRFVTALSGGSTPKKLFERLTAAPFREAIDWRNVIFLWGDERSVPPDHPDSNFGMAKWALLDPLSIPSANILRMEAERPNLTQAASDYESKLRTLLRESGAEGRIDLILLGMGADGHAASLFPETKALDEKGKWVVANEVPQLKTWRMTLTYPILSAARKVLFLVTGGEKAEVLKKVLNGPTDVIKLPSQAVLSKEGETIWLLDEAAGAEISHANAKKTIGQS